MFGSGKEGSAHNSNSTVIHNFFNDRFDRARSTANGNVFWDHGTNWKVLYSYGYHFPLAVQITFKGVSTMYINTDSYSPTTSAQQGLVRSAVFGRTVNLSTEWLKQLISSTYDIEMGKTADGVKRLKRYVKTAKTTHKDSLKGYMAEAARKRTERAFFDAIVGYNDAARHIDNVIKIYGLKLTPAPYFPHDFNDDKSIKWKEEHAKKAKAARAKADRLDAIKRKAAQPFIIKSIEFWRKGILSSSDFHDAELPMTRSEFDIYYYEYMASNIGGNVLCRARRMSTGVVNFETSKQISIELTKCLPLFTLMKLCAERGEGKSLDRDLDGWKLNCISDNGTLYASCHEISLSEAENAFAQYVELIKPVAA